MVEDVMIVDGVRLPIGSFGGRLKSTAAHEMGGIVVQETLKRAQVAPEAVDEVIMGCVGQVSGDAYIGRRIALHAGLPVTSTAQTVNRLCGSGLQAIISGAQWLKAGDASVIVAGGAENMSRLPYYVWNRWGRRLGNGELEDGVLSTVTDPFAHYAMGVTAEIVAQRFHVSREDQDQLAWDSQQRASQAINSGRFTEQIVPISVSEGRHQEIFQVDEHPRNSTMEQLGQLRPVFRKDGTVTAGNSSGINDGAAAVLMMTASESSRRQLRPRARLVSYAVAGVEPEIMGYAPVDAIAKVLQRAGLTIGQMDLVELNEAFAAQTVAVVRDAHLNWERTNVNGGAIALGHPLGATGAILTVKLLYELEARGMRYGLVTMCIGGGQGIAAIFENLRR